MVLSDLFPGKRKTKKKNIMDELPIRHLHNNKRQDQPRKKIAKNVRKSENINC